MKNYLIVILGIISSQKINLFGEVFVGEILCVGVLVFNIKTIRIFQGGRPLLLLLGAWFVVQALSDIVNQTELIRALKGILAPVFVAIILLGLTTAFHRRYKQLPLYIIGVFIGMWLSRVIGSEYYQGNPWKWGLGGSAILCFFTWLEFYCKQNRFSYLIIGSVIFVIISMSNSSRSMAMFIVATCLLVLTARWIKDMPAYIRMGSSLLGFFQFVLFIMLGIFLIDRSIAILFSYGPFLDLLPPLDALKYQTQAESKWGVILGGRAELLVSLEAFFDAPMLGHGSWPENSYYTYGLLDMMDASGGSLMDLNAAESNIKSFLIPTHSYLMGAIVWGGFFAGLFWLRVIKQFAEGFLNPKVITSPLLSYITIWLLWNVLFSPFGADARWLSTLLLWLYFTLLNNLIFKKGLT